MFKLMFNPWCLSVIVICLLLTACQDSHKSVTVEPDRRRLELNLNQPTHSQGVPNMATDTMNTPNDLIAEGKTAPAFTLPDQDGKKHKLSDYKGKWVVLYFYPKDDTPGCTKQACQFNEAEQQLKDLDAVVLGVSPDAVDSKRKFADKFNLDFPILADPDKKVLLKYGVWQEKKNYGKTYLGVVRTTYLINPTGKVAKRWDKVKADGNAAAAVETIQAMQ